MLALDGGYDVGAVHRGLELLGIEGYTAIEWLIKLTNHMALAFRESVPEEVLETLVGFGMEEAAVILDEFRVH